MTTPLVSSLFAKVNAFNAAGIHDRGLGIGVEVLKFVDVPQGYVVKGGVGECAGEKNGVAPNDCGLFRAG